jgi:hypothetical protein
MGCEVYANGNTIACKAADGKSVAAMPDVCLSPPSPPAGPIPIPYPNTGVASDTTEGSKTVQINGQEVMLKNKSYFKKSTGDEAATKSLGMGVVTHQIQGKVNFINWSMDVKFEGENVPRHLDLTGHNEASDPPNAPPWIYTDAMSVSKIPDECKDEAKAFSDNCGPHLKRHGDRSMNAAGTNTAMCDDKECKKARACAVTPYNLGCCDGKTPHHVVPKSQFKLRGASVYTLPPGLTPPYDPSRAPCICESGTSHSNEGNHGDIHTETNVSTVGHPSVIGKVTGKTIAADARWKASESEKIGAQATAKVTKCKEKCIEDQVRKGHENMGIKPNDQIRPTTAGRVPDPVPPPAVGYPP